MPWIQRALGPRIQHILSTGKSILLLGPRQTGKTTLLAKQVHTDLNYTFLHPEIRRQFEWDPQQLIKEIKAYYALHTIKKKLCVLIDEIQKVPQIMDVIQYAIDNQLAQFILTGSSARKLKRHQPHLNLLPGRVIALRMDTLSFIEMSKMLPALESLLLYGSLPEIVLQPHETEKEVLLTSYVNIYLEEEIRSEAIVRQLASFARFLRYAAVEAGKPINMSKLSQEIGISRHTIMEYYQILEDCLIVDRIEPLTTTTSRRRLAKAPKYLFFDLGVRRIAAGEGVKLPDQYYGELFEQLIGMEILKFIRFSAPPARLLYWKDHHGPEVDFVIEYNRQYLPIEVKYTQHPSRHDTRHLRTFADEYPCIMPLYLICQVEHPMEIADHVLAIPWQQLPEVLKRYLG